MKHRTNIRLDDQAREDAQTVAKAYGLGSVSAAVRFALREIAKRVQTADKTTDTKEK
jgi:antitoxin component of RelBE/YafQ-DinJ toxin-antitoxin module